MILRFSLSSLLASLTGVWLISLTIAPVTLAQPATGTPPGTAEQTFRQGEITQAIQEWSRDIQNNRNIDKALLNRAQAYILLKQYAIAIQDLDRLVALPGRRISAETYIVRGIALAENNQLAEAIDSFNQAERIRPSALAYNNRALAYQRQGKLDLALADLQKAVTLSAIPPHQLNLANLQLQLGQNQEAVQGMTQLVTATPNFFPAYVTRGIGYYNLGQFEPALRDFVTALRNQPDQPDAFYYAGLALNRLNRKKEAAQNMLRAAELYLQRNQATLYQQVLDKMAELKLQ
jgi:tetratricopeptide (TPR) repeat protein